MFSAVVKDSLDAVLRSPRGHLESIVDERLHRALEIGEDNFVDVEAREGFTVNFQTSLPRPERACAPTSISFLR
jgi:hypothetical protein